ncbi:hypothetical protein TWF730_007725 [Orbilia blumenaviensis]|uniref:Uncharacterized protein n=1 Tax=Orbilia blumenaviensis TaxID=1796055 RepID=A0AAV9V9E5_9PEZI
MNTTRVVLSRSLASSPSSSSARQLPDFARILPPDAVFASAQKSGFLKCNRAQATKVLTEVWETTRSTTITSSTQDSAFSAAGVAKICAAHNFPPSNFTSLALLLQPPASSRTTSPAATTTNLSSILLSLATSLNDPAAILKSARSKITSSRSLILIESSPIWKKLHKLAQEQDVPEAYELMAETYQNAKVMGQAQEYWTRAAAAGSGRACLVMGRQAVLVGKREVAVQAFKQAAELGEAEAYYELGALQLSGGVKVAPERNEEAEYNLSVAAASGVTRAAVKLAELYKSRNDLAMSEQWSEVASEMKAIE